MTGALDARSHPEGDAAPDQDAVVRRLWAAMPTERLLSQGLDLSDLLHLQVRLTEGETWEDCLSQRALLLGEEAATAARDQQLETAQEKYLRASSCLRVAQAAITSDEERRGQVHAQSVDLFRSAAGLSKRRILELDAYALHGWLLTPGEGTTACVVMLGGIDAWAETWEATGAYALRRGMSVLLLDLPGQGVPRFRDREHYRSDRTQIRAIADAVDWLGGIGIRQVGVWGNSAGGYWALLAAARLDAIGACCTVSTSLEPGEFVARFPRSAQRFCGLFGVPDEGEARRRALAWRWSEQRPISVPTLWLHGGADVLYAPPAALPVLPEFASVHVYPEGKHGLYNVHADKCCRVTDWFSRVLFAA